MERDSADFTMAGTAGTAGAGSRCRQNQSRSGCMINLGLQIRWNYVNIDDAWHGTRDPKTRKISPNEHFGDMKALSEYVHSKGLKLGTYTDLGPKTCGGYEGSLGFEHIDAQTYAEWGIDYVKVDWCHNQGRNPKMAYGIMGDALAKIDRDIVFSICNWGVENPWEWGEEVGGQLWRTSGDITDTWGSMFDCAMRQEPHGQYQKPGHWHDPDMLVIGKVGWSKNLRESRLTPHEQYTHITLWSLLSAPMLLGCDLSDMSEFTLNLIKNKEVIAFIRMALGKQARRVQKMIFRSMGEGPADGTIAVGVIFSGQRDFV